jgi:flagellar biosynthesis/type III secretory pathway protein FliH
LALIRLQYSSGVHIACFVSVLRQAIAELEVLPADAPERVLALPILVRLRLAVPSDRTKQTSDEQEFLMSTQDIVEIWRQEAIQEGVKQGLEQGVKQGLEQGVKQGLERERKLLLRLLRRRFETEVDGETERRIAAASAEQIEIWAERVLSAATLAELLAD